MSCGFVEFWETINILTLQDHSIFHSAQLLFNITAHSLLNVIKKKKKLKWQHFTMITS